MEVINKSEEFSESGENFIESFSENIFDAGESPNTICENVEMVEINLENLNQEEIFKELKLISGVGNKCVIVSLKTLKKIFYPIDKLVWSRETQENLYIDPAIFEEAINFLNETYLGTPFEEYVREFFLPLCYDMENYEY